MEINGKFEAIGRLDSSLIDVVEGGMCYGGIALLWHKNIIATPISGIISDRICGIKFTVDDRHRSMLSVIGVYLPCLDQGVDCYREHLLELEQIVSVSWVLGLVAVLGDFNAHLGCKNCPRDQNLQGVHLRAVLERFELSAISQGAVPSGPVYPYCSEDARIAWNYILMDVVVAPMMDSFRAHPMMT